MQSFRNAFQERRSSERVPLFWGTERERVPFFKRGTRNGTRSWNQRNEIAFRSSFLFPSLASDSHENANLGKSKLIFPPKWPFFVKISCKLFIYRLNGKGAFEIYILDKKIGSLNCRLFLQRNGKGTPVPLLRNEERNAFLFSNLERRTERVPFFSKERGTERVPEIRGTTKALIEGH